jgi:hypothetical protein
VGDAAPHLTGADHAHSVNVSHLNINHIVCRLFVQAGPRLWPTNVLLTTVPSDHRPTELFLL